MPPSRRGAAGGGGGEEGSTARSRIGESMPDRRRDEDTAAIRVSNLSENVQDNDLQEVGFLNSLLLFHTNEGVTWDNLSHVISSFG